MKYEYLQKEVKILSDLIDTEKLPLKERYALQRILADYNNVYMISVDQKEFIKRKNPVYVRESDENEKLRAIVKNQKQQIIGFKEQLKQLRDENKEITSKLKLLLYK